MGIHRSSDSMSRCDVNQYSSLYDVRKRPDIKHDPVSATRSIQKDTIEISRDQLNEEAMTRLRHVSKYVIAQDGFMRIGKYLFLAVALPPYFFLYGLPKWLLVEGLPAIYTISVWMVKKIQHQVKKRLEVVNQKMTQFIHYVQSLAKILMQPIIQMTLQIRQLFSRIRLRFTTPIKSFTAKIRSPLRFLRLSFIQGESLKNLKKSFLEIREKFSDVKEKFGTIVQQTIHWIKESPQAVLGWGQLQFQRMADQMLTFSAKWKETFNPSQKIARETTDWVFKQLKKGANAFQRQFTPLVHLYLKQWLPRWQTIKGFSKCRWDQASDFFKNGHRRALTFLYSRQERLKLLSSDVIIDYITSRAWLNKLPTFFQQYLKKWLSHKFTHLILDKGINLSSLFAKIPLQIAKFSLEAFSHFGTFLKRAGAGSRALIKSGFKSAFDILKAVFKIIKKTAFYVLYYFLLLSTMTVILMTLGLRLLGDCTKDFIKRFSLFKRDA